MPRSLRLSALALLAFGTACRHDTPTMSSAESLVITNAYATSPAGYNELASSFDAGLSYSSFQPSFHRGPGAPADSIGPAGLMGGGLGAAFFGDGFSFGGFMGGSMGSVVRMAAGMFGPGPFGHGSTPASCTFSSTSGTVTCAPLTMGGLTVTRTEKYTDASGKAQSAIDGTTNTVTTNIGVSGTVTHRDSSSSTVTEASAVTVSGLATGSTQRTANGTSGGTERTTGTNATGAFTTVRTSADTTRNVVIPVPTSLASAFSSAPSAGTIIRVMAVNATVAGKTTTSNRREVVTYNGANPATVTITQDGTTKTCTLTMPRCKLQCP